MPSMQATFDIVARHLLAQGGPAMINMGHGPECRYRMANGRKCAAGILIPDSEYDPIFEGIGLRPSTASEKDPLRLRLREIIAAEGHDLDLVEHLQIVHDECGINEEWNALTARLRSVAADFGLDASAVTP